MNAVEFIRKFGWDHTKYLLEDTELSEFAIHSNCAGKYSMDTVSVSDLKRYVDAYELVESYGGLACCKNHIGFLSDLMRQAIADVESCQ